MAKHPHLPESARSDSSDAAPTYAVGYGRPPVHGRFTRGHTKRGGRRKGQRNRCTVVDETLNEKVTVREGNRFRSMTKFEAMILKITNDAVSGNAKAQANIITLTRSLGLMGEPHEAIQAEPFTGDDPDLIADFLERQGNHAESTQSPESTDKPEAGEAEPPSKQSKETKS